MNGEDNIFRGHTIGEDLPEKRLEVLTWQVIREIEICEVVADETQAALPGFWLLRLKRINYSFTFL